MARELGLINTDIRNRLCMHAAADEGLLILEKTKYWPGVIFVLQFVTLDFSYLKLEAVKIQKLLS